MARSCRPCGRTAHIGAWTNGRLASLPTASSPGAPWHRQCCKILHLRADQMAETAARPVRLTGFRAARWAWRFARDPLVAARDAFDAFGPFLVLAAAVPLTRPRRTVLLDVPLVLTAGPAFNRELLSDPATWRGVSLLPGGPRNSAARRISQGLTRVTGERHVQYRRLLAP